MPSDTSPTQKCDQCQRDRREAAEEPGPRHEAADRAGGKCAGKLEDTAGYDRAHTHVPGVPRGGIPLHPGRDGRRKGWPEHEEDHAKSARCVQPQRHGGDVAPAGAPREPEGHPGEEQIAHDHAGRRTGHEVREGKLHGIVEDGRQQGDRQHEIGQIIEGEAKKCVDVAGGRPAIGGGGWIHVCHGPKASKNGHFPSSGAILTVFRSGAAAVFQAGRTFRPATA